MSKGSIDYFQRYFGSVCVDSSNKENCIFQFNKEIYVHFSGFTFVLIEKKSSVWRYDVRNVRSEKTFQWTSSIKVDPSPAPIGMLGDLLSYSLLENLALLLCEIKTLLQT